MVARKMRGLGNAFNQPLQDWQGLPWEISPLLPMPPDAAASEFVDYGTNLQMASPNSCGSAAGSCGGCNCGCSGSSDSAIPDPLGLPWWVWIGGIALVAYPMMRGAK